MKKWLDEHLTLRLINLLLGEPILPSTLAGLGLILGGLLLQKLPVRRPAETVSKDD